MREEGRERERGEREREREEERERKPGEGGGGERERERLREEGRRGKAMIAKRVLNELERYAHPSSWLMVRFGTLTAAFDSPYGSSTAFNIVVLFYFYFLSLPVSDSTRSVARGKRIS